MANYKTGAERYNDRKDKIFSEAKEHRVWAKDGKSSYDKRYWRENKKGVIVKALDKAK